MSGIYNNWFKVQHPNASNDIPPMESNGFQKPFFFGGSQVPISLGIHDTNLHETGRGLKHHSKMNFLPDKKGKGIQHSNHHMQSNIHIPRHMGSLNKSM